MVAECSWRGPSQNSPSRCPRTTPVPEDERRGEDGGTARVASSSLPKRKVLGELGVPKSTYYRWLRRKNQQGLEDDAGGGKPPWNRLTSWEVNKVLSAAREMPELSCRQLAAWVHRQHGLLSLRVDGLPYPSQGGSGEEASDETGCGQGVPPQDHRSPPDVGHRCLLLQGGGLGATTTWSPSWTTTPVSYWPTGFNET